MPTESGAVALVRLRISDTSTNPSEQLLTDDQLTLLLGEHDGSTYRAAADALRTIAASEVLISKKIRTQDLSTDGPAVAASLRALADDYDAKADAEEAESIGALHIVPFGGRHRLEAEGQRY